MIQSTKPNYSRWPQPADIKEENMPEGEDPDNPNYTPSEAEELMTGRAWYVKNYHRGPLANWTTGPRGPEALHRSPTRSLRSRSPKEKRARAGQLTRPAGNLP